MGKGGVNKSRLVFLFGRLFSRREAEAGGRETKEEAQREWKGEREREEESGGGTQRGKWCNKRFRLKSKCPWFNPESNTQGDYPP